MGLALPTLWVIQLVCRTSFNTSAVSSTPPPPSPPPLHELNCIYYNHTDPQTELPDDEDGQMEHNQSTTFYRPQQVHYHCRFNEKIGGQTGSQLAECNSTDAPQLPTRDQWPFDALLDPKLLSKGVSLKVVLNQAASSAVWLTLPTIPFFNGTSSLFLKCDDDYNNSTSYNGTEMHILCALQHDNGPPVPTLPRSKSKWTYLLAIVAIAGGGIGNILVCLAVCLDRSLQNVTNYFLLSLAVADLLVSLFVMPLGAIQGFFGYWPLGIAWCNVYVSCDVLACSCSIMHMCCISLGRYFGIRNPLRTRHHTYSTKRLVGYKIAIVWALSLMVSGWVTFLGLHESTNIMPKPYQCVINNQTFSLFGSLVAFYIPMFIMVVTYTRTVQLLRKKARFLQQKPGSEPEGPTFRHLGGRFRKPPSTTTTAAATTQPPPPITPVRAKRSFNTPLKWRARIVARSTHKNPAMNISSSQPNLIGSTARTNGTGRLADLENTASPHVRNENNAENASGIRSTRLRTLRLPLNVTSANLNLRFLASRSKRQNIAAAANVVRTEQKASKVLGLVFLAFVLCWAPFFLFNVFFTFCDRSNCNQIPDHVVDLALWLGYISSTINPIIYTIFNRTFRSSFNRLLRCKCHRLSRPPRYRWSVNENRTSALAVQTPSSAAAGAAAVPLSLSLQGTPLVTPSSVSSFLANIRSPIIDSQRTSIDLVESSTVTTT